MMRKHRFKNCVWSTPASTRTQDATLDTAASPDAKQVVAADLLAVVHGLGRAAAHHTVVHQLTAFDDAAGLLVDVFEVPREELLKLGKGKDGQFGEPRELLLDPLVAFKPLLLVHPLVERLAPARAPSERGIDHLLRTCLVCAGRQPFEEAFTFGVAARRTRVAARRSARLAKAAHWRRPPRD
jgi:hypothetical protein